MAKLCAHDDNGESKTVCDPTCGSGRMLLAAAKENPHRLFIGQDIDLNCVKITALNLAFRGLYGRMIWGDSLRHEQKLIYATGFNGKGFIQEMRPAPATDPPKIVADEEVGSPPKDCPAPPAPPPTAKE